MGCLQCVQCRRSCSDATRACGGDGRDRRGGGRTCWRIVVAHNCIHETPAARVRRNAHAPADGSLLAGRLQRRAGARSSGADIDACAGACTVISRGDAAFNAGCADGAQQALPLALRQQYLPRAGLHGQYYRLSLVCSPHLEHAQTMLALPARTALPLSPGAALMDSSERYPLLFGGTPSPGQTIRCRQSSAHPSCHRLLDTCP